MELRNVTAADLNLLVDIDGTIESDQYLFIEQTGDGGATTFSLQPRPTREKLILPNRLDDETTFAARQIVTGADEGVALVADHDALPVALLLARPLPQRRVMELIDLRVDYDQRRQGLGLAMMFHLINAARQQEYRAVVAEVKTSNWPAINLLQKCGFQLSGLDTRRGSNHDLVKEEVTLFWYVELEQ